MKTEMTKDDHCPYCKRHCSLKNPHCKKGKDLAEKMKREAVKKEALKDTLKETAAVMEEVTPWTILCGEIRLYRMLQKVCKEVIKKKNGSEIYGKDRFYLLALLAEKGPASCRYLEESMGQPENGLNELLCKLEKKEWLRYEKNGQGERSIVLTAKGLRAAGELQKARREKGGNIFSVLTEEDKTTMEGILKKIME